MDSRAIILSGRGRYSDPWHRYEQTSARLAELVSAAGFEVSVRDDIDAALASLDEDVALIVVNAGDPDGPVDPEEVGTDGPVDLEEVDSPPVAAHVEPSALEAAVDRGVGILALHAAASSLRDYPAFDRALGGRWVRDTSWHPEIGDAHVHLVGDHAVREGLDDFVVFDERYSDLRLHDVIEPIAEHEEQGIRHPLVWAREFGPSRLVYDGLGHDVRSYDSAEHRRLLGRAIEWLAAAPGLRRAGVG